MNFTFVAFMYFVNTGYYCPAGSISAIQNVCPSGYISSSFSFVSFTLCCLFFILTLRSYCVLGSTSPVGCQLGSYGDVTGLSSAGCVGLCIEGIQNCECLLLFRCLYFSRMIFKYLTIMFHCFYRLIW